MQEIFLLKNIGNIYTLADIFEEQVFIIVKY